jgi:hypothetical protein
MLGKLEDFTRWAKMEVNVKKCNTASYVEDSNRHRCSPASPLKLNGNDIPNLTLAESMKYLGTAVAVRRTVKIAAVDTKLTEMKVRLQKIMDSPLLTVRKIDALKTFVLPMIDFMMLNGDVGVKQLTVMDKCIRGKVDKALKVRGLPVECHHASWRDGGLSYPSLVDRRQVLLIRSFSQMLLSRDEKIKKATIWFVNHVRGTDTPTHRHIDEDEDEDGLFMNWKSMAERDGTSCLAIRTRKACQNMKVKFKMKDEAVELSAQEPSGREIRIEAKTPEKIGRFLTQNIIRPDKFRQLISHDVHGAAYTTLRDNAISNRNLIDSRMKRTDAFFRFEVVGRADCLATPANLGRWFPNDHERISGQCRRCGHNHVMTMAHLSNECAQNFGQMTQRHNEVCKMIREATITHVGPGLRSDRHPRKRPDWKYRTNGWSAGRTEKPTSRHRL